MAKKLVKKAPVAAKSQATLKASPSKFTPSKAAPARAVRQPALAVKAIAHAPGKALKSAPSKSLTMTKAVKSSTQASAKVAPSAATTGPRKLAPKPASTKANGKAVTTPVKVVPKVVAKVVASVIAKPTVAKPAANVAETVSAKVTAKGIAKSAPVAPPVAQPLAVSRPVASTKPGVKNGASASAKIALKPSNVAGLATERSTPVVKASTHQNGGMAKPVLKLAKRPRPEPIPVRLPPAPVRSDSKMARNRAGITPRELEHFRDLLFQKRRELTGDVSSMENTALSTGSGSLSTLPMHMADAGTDNYEQEFTLGLVEKDRKLLHEINVALAKIQDGSYGICEGTGKPIAKPRLEAQPWAKILDRTRPRPRATAVSPGVLSSVGS